LGIQWKGIPGVWGKGWIPARDPVEDKPARQVCDNDKKNAGFLNPAARLENAIADVSIAN